MVNLKIQNYKNISKQRQAQPQYLASNQKISDSETAILTTKNPLTLSEAAFNSLNLEG